MKASVAIILLFSLIYSADALGQILELSPPAEAGTYQFLVPNPKMRAELFPNSILNEIEELRHDQITKVVKVGEHTWVRILSRDIIDDPEFTPLPDEVGFIELEEKITRPEK